ncbi:MAG: hypothetical protein IJ722_06475 [Alloprevotella sp.]|nr:hypothetical protein [Alloprevotella sp.]
MSDGNYNRSLLPADRYASGVRAGEARMKERAVTAFASWLRIASPELTEDSVREQIVRFRELLG